MLRIVLWSEYLFRLQTLRYIYILCLHIPGLLIIFYALCMYPVSLKLDYLYLFTLRFTVWFCTILLVQSSCFLMLPVFGISFPLLQVSGILLVTCYMYMSIGSAEQTTGTLFTLLQVTKVPFLLLKVTSKGDHP